MKEILSYKNVSFRRDGREILKNINWEIKKGENWALLGLNGSGKSTLLSMIPAGKDVSCIVGKRGVLENE